MTDHLKFLRGTIQDTHPVEAMRNVRLYAGRAQVNNSVITVDVPFDCGGLDVAVPASQFITAMELCEEPNMKVTPAKRLLIKEGTFKASLPMTDIAAYPKMQPDGDRFDVRDNFLNDLITARTFTGNVKEWSKGVIIATGKLYATNGFSLVCVDAGLDESITAIIPETTIAELARIGEPIDAIRVSDTSVTFKLGESTWLRTSLITAEPPEMDRLIKSTDVVVHPELRGAVEKLARFSNDKFSLIRMDTGGVYACDNQRDEPRASLDMEGLSPGWYNAALLRDVLELATHIDLSTYPDASPFVGDHLSGAIIGIRQS